MKKFLLLLCAITLAACSDDDNGSSGGIVPTTITLSGDANSSFNKTIHITYDDKQRIKDVLTEDGVTYSFFYASDKRISEIQYSDGNNVSVTTVTYDSKGRISVLGSEDSTTPISYFDDGTFSIFGTIFGYTSAHDIGKYSDFTFTYENSKKGAFANVSTYEPIIMALIDESSLFYATHKPLKALTTTEVGVGYTVQNAYNDKGYVSTATLSGAADATITYDYEDL